MINVFAFSSESMTNIWAGVGAQMWAVPKAPNPSVRGKAAKLPVPAFGILYDAAAHRLTVPFVILETPNPSRVEASVWNGEWALPFRMKPLGTPRKTLSAIEASQVCPSFARLNTDNFGKVFRVSGAYAFNRCDLEWADWNILMERLAD